MFVTSRGFELPDAWEEMDGSGWFNLWQRRLWPCAQLAVGDDLWWYESPTKRIVWRTRVTAVEAFRYGSLDEAFDRMDAFFREEVDRSQPYLDGRPEVGWCLAYQVGAVERLDLPKPAGVSFNRLGWERGDALEIRRWIGASPGERGPHVRNPSWARDEVVLALDLYVRAGSLGGGPLPGAGDRRVLGLSRKLQRLRLHPPGHRGAEFRNPRGVALKLANLRAVERDVAVEVGAPGAGLLPRGMARYSALDRRTFEEFHGQWDRLAEEAAAISAQATSGRAALVVGEVEVGPVESAWVDSFETSSTGGGIRVRREAQLVQRYATWLGEQGIVVVRHRYSVPGEVRSLACDAYVPSRNLLLEAKAQDDRNSVRLAIGQLLDYRRFLEDPEHAQLAVLLPGRPSPDHQELLRSVGIGWIWPGRGGGFVEATGQPPG